MASSKQTQRFKFPLMVPAQASKHIVHNEALLSIDALVQLSVIERTASVPSTPREGDRFIVGTQDKTATSVWAGPDNNVAEWRNNVWIFHAPAT